MHPYKLEINKIIRTTLLNKSLTKKFLFQTLNLLPNK
jgi:hypothetical protein